MTDLAPTGNGALRRVAERLHGVTQTRRGIRARCPAHDDSDPSLDIDLADDGRLLVTCRSAHCSAAAVMAAIGLTMTDLFSVDNPPHERPSSRTKRQPKVHNTIEALTRAAAWSVTDRGQKPPGKCTRYDYTDAAGNKLGGVLRFDFTDGRPKELRRFRRDDAGWMLKDMDAPRPMYRLFDICGMDANTPLLFVEGEKCAEAARDLGFVATTSSGGAKQPLAKTDFSSLANRDVVIMPDNDSPGLSYAAGIADRARAHGASRVRILELPNLGPGDDVFDWIAHQRNDGDPDAVITDRLLKLVQEAPLWPSQPSEQEDPEATDSRGDSPHEASWEGPIPLGSIDPDSGRVVLSLKKTLPTAKLFLRQFYELDGHRTLVEYATSLWQWMGNRYLELEERQLAHHLQHWLHEALRYFVNRKDGKPCLTGFDSNPGSVRAAIETIRAEAYLDANTAVPAWLGEEPPPFPLSELLACKNHTLHVPSQTLLPPSPKLFTFNAIDFDYDAQASEPHRWFAFLKEVFGEDEESIRLLQEWFGYCLTADTSQQKMLLMVGPRRSGKGTIARVIKELVGGSNVAGPTIGSLTGNFGLQPLLGKSLAIVSDARFSGDNIQALVERLLCVSGEDTLTIDRKYLTSVTMKLPVKFMFLTNELPRIQDSSTALAGRFVVLRLLRSYFGKENHNLTEELLAELPGILLWALIGWQSLRERGRFQEPESSRAAIQDIEDLSSPVSAFVRERCVVGAGHRVSCHDLYQAWCQWCSADGRTSHTTAQVFGRDLSAAVAGFTRRRCTGRPSFYDGIGLKTGGTP
ncbi:MAG: hypothetical protein JNK49_21630 [Planctomycetes bacterium]|nr:hypothetical protein [Planctomycetota bacterium]